jgi:hypothetical protein
VAIHVLIHVIGVLSSQVYFPVSYAALSHLECIQMLKLPDAEYGLRMKLEIPPEKCTERSR